MGSETKPSGPRPFAVIIGAMKSGTTTLFELLSQHPQIAACSVKEPRFFSDDEVWSKGWSWYEALWKWDDSKHRVALEGSTQYTTYPARRGIPQRMASIPRASFRFIYLMRNPLDQIESNVRHTLYLGWGQPLDQGIQDWMIETVSYATQIEQFTNVFSRESMLLLTLDEMEADPAAVLVRVSRFLEVDPDFRFEQVEKKYNRGDAYEVTPAVATMMKAAPLRWLAQQVIPRSVRHGIRALLPRLTGQKRDFGRYRLTAEERSRLAAQLAPEMQMLQERYGVAVPRGWQPYRGEQDSTVPYPSTQTR